MPLRKKLQIFEPNCCSLANRDLPNPSPIFSIRSANTWHYPQRNQLHLKDRIMKSTFTKQFTTKFQLSSVIFKKWIGFCLINASSVSHIFFLVSAEFFCKGNSWLSSWGWAFIWDNNNSQAREKLIVSWRKSGNFKICISTAMWIYTSHILTDDVNQ